MHGVVEPHVHAGHEPPRDVQPALACGTMLLIVTFMSVIPLGLIWARLEHVSIKKISQESEHLEPEDAERAPAVSEA